MHKITVPATKLYDEKRNLFINTKEQILCLEHSLISVSKWESKWCEPFFGKDDKDTKTTEQTLDYIRCMTLTQNVDPDVYYAIGYNRELMLDIVNYIKSPMTATKINKIDKAYKRPTEYVTSELIYYWMFSYEIPIECEKWPLNRLITLIEVFNVKNQKQGKTNGMTKESLANRKSEMARRRAAARRK